MRFMVLMLLLGACDRQTITPPPAEPEVIAVDWHGRGPLFAASVVGRRGGLTHVEYADGESDWVDVARIHPWPALQGQRVQVWTRASAHDAAVVEIRAALLHVRFDDGGDTWVSRDMLYLLQAPVVPPPPPPPPPRPTFAPHRPADPAAIRVGAFVLAYWSHGRSPWVCEVRAIHDRQADLSYSDGTTDTVSFEEIVRVFEGHVTPRPGMRVWIMGTRPVGTVIETRAGLVNMRIGDETQWIEVARILAPAPPIDPALLVEGAQVTAIWSGQSAYEATVTSRSEGNVTLAWHDGSAASEIPIGDVLEVWPTH